MSDKSTPILPSSDPFTRIFDAIKQRGEKTKIVNAHQREWLRGQNASPSGFTAKEGASAGYMSHWDLAGDSGSAAQVDEGETATITGGTQHPVAMSGNAATVSGLDASTTAKGHASFNANHFTVASGAVSQKVLARQDWIGPLLIDDDPSNSGTWAYDAHPAAAGSVVPTAFRTVYPDFTNFDVDAVQGCLRWAARYENDPAPLLMQDIVNISVPFLKVGSGIILRARLKASAAADFDWIKLFLCDGDGDHDGQLGADCKASIDGAWAEVALDITAVNISGWETYLRCGVFAQGKEWTDVGTHNTSLYIERITVEQYA